MTFYKALTLAVGTKRAKRIWLATGLLAAAAVLLWPQLTGRNPSLEIPDAVQKTELASMPEEAVATVERTVDGDTVRVRLNGRSETIRLIGVDTPETVDPRKEVQCFGKEASAFTERTLLGKAVTLERDVTQGDRDKYGRLLRYVLLEDGTNFNMLLIREGYAHEYTYDSHPYGYQEEFLQAEAVARAGMKGLWAEGACVS